MKTPTPLPAPAPAEPTSASPLPRGTPASAALRAARGRLLDDEDAGGDAPANADADANAGSNANADANADAPVDPEAVTHREDSCRQIRGDGTEEDCDHSGIWPWMIAGSGVLLAGAAGAGSHGSDSHASDSHATAAAPTPPPAPPAPPAPPQAPLPAAPRLSTSSGKDTIDGAGHVDVTLASPGASWVYRIDGDNTWHAGQGDSIDAATVSSGVHAVMVAQVDDQGRVGEVATLAVRVHDEALVTGPAPDLIPPDAPLLQTSNGTNLLNAKDFINVSGIEGGASWKYRVNGQGDWIDGHDGRIPATALVNGENRIDVMQVDAAGNASVAATLTVQQDLEAPDPLQMHLVGDRNGLIPMQGGLAIDNLEAGATWKYRLNGESDWHVGTGTELPGIALFEGRNDVQVVQTDASGHDSAVTTITVTRDSLAPDRPDLVTSNGLPLINAQGSLLVHLLEPGATWEYRVDGGDWLVGNGDALSAAALREGSQTVDVRQTDAAGNVSAIDTLAVTLDATPPDALAATAHARNGAEAANRLINATGYLSIDNLESGATWQFKIGDDDRWRNGTGSHLSTRVLDEGDNTIQIRQMDAAGNIGATGHIDVVLDTVAPDAPTVSTSSGRSLVNGENIDLGNLEAGGTVTLLVNGQEKVLRPGISSVQLLDPAYNFKLGTNSVSAFQVDAAGNKSETRSMSFTWDYIEPEQVRFAFNLGSDNAVSKLSEYVSITNREQGATLMYRIDGGAWKELESNQVLGGELFANQPGTPTEHDFNGDFALHSLEAYQIDAAGNIGVFGQPITVKSYLTAPPAGV